MRDQVNSATKQLISLKSDLAEVKDENDMLAESLEFEHESLRKLKSALYVTADDSFEVLRIEFETMRANFEKRVKMLMTERNRAERELTAEKCNRKREVDELISFKERLEIRIVQLAQKKN